MLGYWISMQENPPAGLYAWILYITAKIAHRGAIWDNIYFVNGCVFDNIFVYFTEGLTMNMLSKMPQKGNLK